jgi:P4 family phage/plasmid primase-like protien
MASQNIISSTPKYDIYNFLEEHRVEKGKTYTHTSMGKPCGAYFIKIEELEFFYQLYEKAILSGYDLHIVEKHEEYGPIIIDLDFRFDLEINERKHNSTHIEKIIEIYVNEICAVFDIEKDDHRLTCFVFERDQIYKSNGVTKDGIHLMFPLLISHPPPQHAVRNNILKKIGPLLSDIPLINPISDVVDKAVIESSPWLLFGSKKPNCEPYKITYIYNGLIQNIPIETYDFGGQSLVKFFSIRNKSESSLIPVRSDKLDLIDTITKKKLNNKPKLSSKLSYDIEQIKEFIALLDTKRAENYTDWIQLGWALHNIDPNSKELLDIWIEFSKSSSKFKEGGCEDLWEKSKNEGLTIRSIHHWAKKDSPKEYEKIMDKDISKLIISTTTSPTNYDIANVLFIMYKYDFKYSGSEWYIFNNHTWVKEIDGYSLRQKISNNLCDKYFRLMSDYNKCISQDNITEEEREEYKKKNAEVLEIVKKLKTTSFKENIMKECKELFFDKDFIYKLDTNPWLLGFKNGIYDLKNGELRDGGPDDYVMMNTEIDKLAFDENNEHWEDLQHFISTIFVDKEIRNYFLTYLATCLQGHNAEEKLRIWTGHGSNGKSKILELFMSCLGNYAIKFPITLLTGKRAASNACTPEVVDSKGKRFAYLDEPGENEKINIGLLKEFTGGDKIKARGLYKEAIEFKPQFKLTLLCNEIPEVPPNESGTWRRMEVIEFKSRFCDNPKEEHEFPIDKYLSEKMKNWKELFMSLLIDIYYPQYRKLIENGKNMVIPTEIVKFTLEYQKQCDRYIEFINDNIQDTKDNADCLDITELYNEFKVWYEDTFGDNKHINKAEFRTYLKKKYTVKRVTSKYIKGFRFKEKTDIPPEELIEKNVPNVFYENSFDFGIKKSEEVFTKPEFKKEIIIDTPDYPSEEDKLKNPNSGY